MPKISSRREKAKRKRKASRLYVTTKKQAVLAQTARRIQAGK